MKSQGKWRRCFIVNRIDILDSDKTVCYFLDVRQLLFALVFVSNGLFCLDEDVCKAHETLDHLLYAIRSRLFIMEDVAKWKWKTARPLERSECEEGELSQFCMTCRKSGIDTALLTTICEAQFRAGTMIQIDLFDAWLTSGCRRSGEATCPAYALREEVATLTQRLLEAGVKAVPYIEGGLYADYIAERASLIVRGGHITDEVRDEAIEPLVTPPR
jgi:chorismate mutase